MIRIFNQILLDSQIVEKEEQRRGRAPIFPKKNRSKLCIACSDVVGLAGFEPAECQSQSLVPYHLATAQKIRI